MPEATFCVYQGVAFGGRGEVCATGVVVMWSSFASPAAAIVERAERQSGSNSVSKRKVYLAFVTEPEVVLWANVESERGDRADMVAYTLGSDDAPQLLAGRMTLRAKRAGSADVLSMDLREPRRWQPGDCVFASYSGTFLGMIHSPSETTTAADAFVAPRR